MSTGKNMNGSCIKDIELISVLPFWEHLSDNQKKYAANHTVIRHYEKGRDCRHSPAGKSGRNHTV